MSRNKKYKWKTQPVDGLGYYWFCKDLREWQDAKPVFVTTHYCEEDGGQLKGERIHYYDPWYKLCPMSEKTEVHTGWWLKIPDLRETSPVELSRGFVMPCDSPDFSEEEDVNNIVCCRDTHGDACACPECERQADKHNSAGETI